MIKPLIGLINLTKSVFLLFKSYPQKKLFFIFIFLTLVASFVEIATIGSLLPLVDLLTDSNRYSDIKYFNIFVNFFNIEKNDIKIFTLIVFTILIIVSYLIKLIIILVNSYLNHEVAFYIHNKVVKKIINQNYKYFINSNTSNILGTIEKVEAVRNVVFSLLLLLLSSIMSLSIIILLFTVDFTNSLILFIFLGIVYFLMYLLTHKKFNEISFLQAKVINKKYRLFLELSQNIKEIILRNLDNFIFKKQFNIILSLRDSRIKEERLTNITTQTTVLMISLLVILILFYFVIFNKNLTSNAPLIVFYIFALQRLNPHIQNAYVSLMSGIKLPQYSIQDVLKILDLPDERTIIRKKYQEKILHIKNQISVSNLQFSHDKNSPNLFEGSNLNFEVGKIYGLTGASGVGKTTFLDIFMGLLKTCEGDFYLDEKKIDIFNNPNWQNLTSYVSQNAVLTDGTFLENICFGEDLNKIDKLFLEDCAKKAECLDFIKKRIGGFQAEIGEGGSKISGGQRQRILLARALFSKKTILILDEATNAIDKATENKIFKNLEAIKQDKIIIVISHNNEIKKNFDCIYKFENKKIIQD